MEESQSELDNNLDDNESSICFENIEIAKYRTVQAEQFQQSPLKSQETVSDEVLNTQNDIQNAVEDFTHHRMKSPDVKKMMNKAYLFMNSKVQRGSSMHNSDKQSTPSQRYMTPQWKTKSAAGETEKQQINGKQHYGSRTLQ